MTNDLTAIHDRLDGRLDTIRTALAECRDDFERIQVRDQAAALAAAACILKRKDIQVQCAELVQRAEREVAKANPPKTRQETGRGKKLALPEGELSGKDVRNIRAAHRPVTDERFEALAAEARAAGAGRLRG